METKTDVMQVTRQEMIDIIGALAAIYGALSVISKSVPNADRDALNDRMIAFEGRMDSVFERVLGPKKKAENGNS